MGRLNEAEERGASIPRIGGKGNPRDDIRGMATVSISVPVMTETWISSRAATGSPEFGC